MSRLPARPPVFSALALADAGALEDLYIRGTPANTLRAYARDLAYLTAWKQAAFGTPLLWPEREDVALRFLLDHSRGLQDAPLGDAARMVAEATLDRRIAARRY